MKRLASEAVILMAGSGSRLRSSGENSRKPLVALAGRPLISYTFDALAKAGIEKIHAVVGFESDSLRAAIEPLIPAGIKFSWIDNPNWQKQNGISVLAAATHASAPFLLTMGDHIFEESILDLMLRNADLDELNLAVDRKVDRIFDLDDAMKVQTRGDRIVAIGKNLSDYDAIDTGLFLCPHAIFDYLDAAKRDGDCHLADGVRLMAADGKARAIDVGGAWWQDVDSVEMLEHARKLIATRERSDSKIPNPSVERDPTG
jgi:1L-myo-inositol 1-phosphate cytidylyltransferase